MKEQLRATEEEFSAKTEALRAAENALTDKQGELAKINSELSDRSMMAESRQVELVAVRAQIENLKKSASGDAEEEGGGEGGRARSRETRARRPPFAATQARLTQERTESETASRELSSDARGRVENLSQRVTRARSPARSCR